MTEALDQVFGRVMDALERSGHAENTLVIFSSDNGALGSVSDTRPLRAAKGYLYEGGIRVPTMMRWPAVTKAGVDATPVVSTDFFPTILEAAGVALPEGYPDDGTSLMPLLRGEAMKRDALYFHYPNYAFHRDNRLGSAIRAGSYKLIENFDDGSLELYDLGADIGEQNNLVEEMPELALGLRSELAEWRQQVGARMPVRAR